MSENRGERGAHNACRLVREHQATGRTNTTLGVVFVQTDSRGCLRTCQTGRAKEGQLVRNASGHVVGLVASDGWLEKRGLDPKLHMLRKPPGWATDAAHLELRILGIRLVTKDGQVWESAIATWRKHGIRIRRGHGAQVVLPVRFWSVRSPGIRQLQLVWVG